MAAQPERITTSLHQQRARGEVRIMARWAERFLVAMIFVIFVLAGVLVWAVVIFRGML